MKRRLTAIFLCAACLTVGIAGKNIVFADGEKVVTLGADLSAEQKEAILRYFGIYGQNIRTLTITNQDERDHLASYVPLEQIGTHTYSCAYVSPTRSGGIHVKTANLDWVTSNMIATTLSTSGVINCDVLAAAPFEVSGTGALTGILMAYESAVGENLDESKKELATQELITTTTLADDIGQLDATNIVNQSKIQIIQGNVISQDDISVIVDGVAQKENITLSDEDRQLLTDLMTQIADQNYDYDEMKDTLEMVESNVDALSNAMSASDSIEDAEVIEDSSVGNAEEAEDSSIEDADTLEIDQAETASGSIEEAPVLTDDSILMKTDDSALGDAVIIDSTNAEALQTDSSESILNAEVIDESSDLPEDGYDVDADDPEGMGDISDAEVIEDSSDEIPGAEVIEDENDSMEAGLASDAIPLSDFNFEPYSSYTDGYQIQPAGVSQLYAYFDRDDITVGYGTLTVYQASDSAEYETIPMSDAVIVPMTKKENERYGFENGKKAVINLYQPLSSNMTYYLTLSEGAFLTTDGCYASEASQDELSWMIETGTNGIYLEGSSLIAGSEASAYLEMDSSVSYAQIQRLDSEDAVTDTVDFYQSGDFSIQFLKSGKCNFSVVYYDAQGNEIETQKYSYYIL